jgi:hypothetical protein
MSLLNRLKREFIYVYRDRIVSLGNDGRHVLESGKVASVLTDEKLKPGDQVLIIEDNRGKLYILAGRK